MDNIKNLEKILKGLANRRRLAIARFLFRRKEASVADIARELGLSFKATSKHLVILRQLDIIDSRQEDLHVYYRLSDSMPRAARDILQHISNSR